MEKVGNTVVGPGQALEAHLPWEALENFSGLDDLPPPAGPCTFSTLWPVSQLMSTWSLKKYLACKGSIFPWTGGCSLGHSFPGGEQ